MSIAPQETRPVTEARGKHRQPARLTYFACPCGTYAAQLDVDALRSLVPTVAAFIDLGAADWSALLEWLPLDLLSVAEDAVEAHERSVCPLASRDGEGE